MKSTPKLDIKVRCCGSYHYIHLHSNGQLSFSGHTSIKELDSEYIIKALGGTECRCAQLLNSWRNRQSGPMPSDMQKAFKEANNNTNRVWLKYQKKRRPVIAEPNIMLDPNEPDRNNKLLNTIVEVLKKRNWTVITAIGYDKTTLSIASLNSIPVNIQGRNYSVGGIIMPEICCYGMDYKRFSYSTTTGFDLANFIDHIEEFVIRKMCVMSKRGDTESKEWKKEYKKLSKLDVDKGIRVGTQYNTSGINVSINVSTRDMTVVSSLMKTISKSLAYLRRKGKLS